MSPELTEMASGSSRIMANEVSDFPDPDSPTRAKTSPCLISKLIPFNNLSGPTVRLRFSTHKSVFMTYSLGLTQSAHGLRVRFQPKPKST